MRKIYYIIIFLLSIFLINSVYGYSNSSIKAYFTLGDGYGTDIYDSHNQVAYTNQNGGYLFAFNGRVGNAIYSDRGLQFNTSLEYIYDNDFSYNFWYSNQINGEDLVNPLAVILNYEEENNETSFTFTGEELDNTQIISDFKLSQYYSGKIVQFNFSKILTQWSMFTITYDKDTTTMKIYINNELQETLNLNENLFSQVNDDGIIIYFYHAQLYDELSFWNSTLTPDDVEILYNNGNGLSYSQTLFSTNITLNYSFDGFYHDYCWFNVLCANYNVSTQLCDDEVFKVCNKPNILPYPCADTFDSYQNAGLENVTASFSGECVGDEYYLQYPSYEGINGSVLLDVCTGTYLCHVYNVSSGECPNYYNGVQNKISCVQQTGSIVAECFDTLEYYNDLNTYPPNNNYSAECSECKSDCTLENSLSCYDINKVQQCQKYRSCLKEFTIKTCATNEVCNLGQCITNSTTIKPSDDINYNDDELSDGERKQIKGLIITLITSIITGVIIGVFNKHSPNSALSAMLAFLFVFLAGLVFFSLIGWFSEIFAILVGLLDAIFIGIVVKMIFFSARM